MRHERVIKAIQTFANKHDLTFRFRVSKKDDSYFEIDMDNGNFYKQVFEKGAEDLSDGNCLFRQFCTLLRDFRYVYMPGNDNQLYFACLNDIDTKSDKQEEVVAIPINYSEDDVLS